jgi:hypothetical protein
VLNCQVGATGVVTFCAVCDIRCHPAALVPSTSMPSPPAGSSAPSPSPSMPPCALHQHAVTPPALSWHAALCVYTVMHDSSWHP